MPAVFVSKENFRATDEWLSGGGGGGPTSLQYAPPLTVSGLQNSWSWYSTGMLIVADNSPLVPNLVIGKVFDVVAGASSGRVQVTWVGDASVVAGQPTGFTLTDIAGTMWATTLRTWTGDTVWTLVA